MNCNSWISGHDLFELITKFYSQKHMLFSTYIFVVQHPYSGPDRLIVEVSRSHSDTPHSVGIPWTGDLPSQRPLPGNRQYSKGQTSVPRQDSENIWYQRNTARWYILLQVSVQKLLFWNIDQMLYWKISIRFVFQRHRVQSFGPKSRYIYWVFYGFAEQLQANDGTLPSLNWVSIFPIFVRIYLIIHFYWCE
jgi:hypothetical protein